MKNSVNVREFMALAIKEASKNLKSFSGGPFGACIVKSGKVIAVTCNTVLKDNDATCHAEINAIRRASKKLKTFDLSGCVIYSTTEPCPMCFSAIHWARVSRVVYGTSIAEAKKRGFNELGVSNKALKRLGRSPVKIIAGFMNAECSGLLSRWDKVARMVTY